MGNREWSRSRRRLRAPPHSPFPTADSLLSYALDRTLPDPARRPPARLRGRAGGARRAVGDLAGRRCRDPGRARDLRARGGTDPAVEPRGAVGAVRARRRPRHHRRRIVCRAAGPAAGPTRLPRGRRPGLGTRLDGPLPADALRPTAVDRAVERRIVRRTGCRRGAPGPGPGLRHRHPSDHGAVPSMAGRPGPDRSHRHRLRLRFRRAGDRRAQARRRARHRRGQRPAGADRHTATTPNAMASTSALPYTFPMRYRTRRPTCS